MNAVAQKTITTITMPELNPGEIYKGILVSETGQPLHHLIEIPCGKDASFEQSRAITKTLGGSLPSRKEGPLLRASDPGGLRGAFWLDEPSAGDESYAWCQLFYDGCQYLTHKTSPLRARAVRRVAI